MTSTKQKQYGFRHIFAQTEDPDDSLVAVVATDEFNKKVDGFYSSHSLADNKFVIDVYWDSKLLYTWTIELVSVTTHENYTEDEIKIEAVYGELMEGENQPSEIFELTRTTLEEYIENFSDKFREILEDAKHQYERAVSDYMLRNAAMAMETWLASEEISDFLEQADVEDMWEEKLGEFTPTGEYLLLLEKVLSDNSFPENVISVVVPDAHIHGKLFMSKSVPEKKLPRLSYDMIPVFGYVDNYEPITEDFTIGFVAYYTDAECQIIQSWEIEEYMEDQGMDYRNLEFHLSN